MDMQSVQATMLIPLYARAKFSRLYPDIMCDDDAIRMIERMAFDFTEIDAIYGREVSGLSCHMRALRLDNKARDWLTEHPNGTVVNLGSGMDSTFNRVDNGSVIWYNLDMPDAIAFRNKYIQPTERCMDIAKSMFDYSWLQDVDAPDGHVLILAGGLFQYFEEAAIRQLVCNIIEHFPTGELFFDTGSKRGIKITNRSVRKTGNSGSEMKFWVNNPAQLKEWSPRIRSTETFPLLGETARHPNLSFSTRLTMRICDRLGMVKLVSVRW